MVSCVYSSNSWPLIPFVALMIHELCEFDHGVSESMELRELVENSECEDALSTKPPDMLAD